MNEVKIDGRKLRELRTARFLDASEVAKMARLDPWTIKRLESGDWGGSRLRTVRKLAEALEVDPRELLEEE